jgi:hypothetical protein
VAFMKSLSMIELLQSVIPMLISSRALHSSRVFDHWQAIERRKMEFPDRPLIRISSTFFWNLSSDYLVPIAALKDKAGILRAKNLEAGLDEGDEVVD